MSKPKKGKSFKYSLEALKKVRDIREKKEQEELVRAEKSAVAKAMVELPSNYQLLGFSDWIMMQMMQQY